jgi:HEAT repeat protein
VTPDEAGRAGETPPRAEPVSVTGVPASVSRSRLERLGITVDPAELAVALRTGSLAVRVEAAFLLGTGLSHDPAAAAELRRAMTDGDARVRVEAAYWLARTKQERGAHDLLVAELAGAPFADAPIRAAVALARLGDPSGYATVVQQLSSPLPSNRFEAVAALPSFQPHQGRQVRSLVIDLDELLNRAMLDPEEMVRSEAELARALMRGE